MHRYAVAIAVACLVSNLAQSPTTAESFVNWETPHVHPIDMTPDGTKLLAVNTADNRLEVFDIGTGTPVPIVAIPFGLDQV